MDREVERGAARYIDVDWDADGREVPVEWTGPGIEYLRTGTRVIMRTELPRLPVHPQEPEGT